MNKQTTEKCNKETIKYKCMQQKTNEQMTATNTANKEN